MLAVLCGRVKYSGEGYQKCPRKNANGDHRETEDGRNDPDCSDLPLQPVWPLAGSGCFTLSTVPDVKFDGKAFP